MTSLSSGSSKEKRSQSRSEIPDPVFAVPVGVDAPLVDAVGVVWPEVDTDSASVVVGSSQLELAL